MVKCIDMYFIHISREMHQLFEEGFVEEEM